MPNSQLLNGESGFPWCAVSALLKHACIVGQRLQIPDNDPTELRVCWIDEAVIFMRCEDGRDEEQTAVAEEPIQQS